MTVLINTVEMILENAIRIHKKRLPLTSVWQYGGERKFNQQFAKPGSGPGWTSNFQP